MSEDLVNQRLKEYIQNNIFKIYDLNGEAHGINHIKYVLYYITYFDAHPQKLLEGEY